MDLGSKLKIWASLGSLLVAIVCSLAKFVSSKLDRKINRTKLTFGNFWATNTILWNIYTKKKRLAENKWNINRGARQQKTNQIRTMLYNATNIVKPTGPWRNRMVQITLPKGWDICSSCWTYCSTERKIRPPTDSPNATSVYQIEGRHIVKMVHHICLQLLICSLIFFYGVRDLTSNGSLYLRNMQARKLSNLLVKSNLLALMAFPFFPICGLAEKYWYIMSRVVDVASGFCRDEVTWMTTWPFSFQWTAMATTIAFTTMSPGIWTEM